MVRIVHVDMDMGLIHRKHDVLARTKLQFAAFLACASRLLLLPSNPKIKSWRCTSLGFERANADAVDKLILRQVCGNAHIASVEYNLSVSQQRTLRHEQPR